MLITQGPQGITGRQGGLFYIFSNSFVESELGNGYFKFNNPHINSVTEIYIDNNDYVGVDHSNFFTSISTGYLLIYTSTGIIFEIKM